MNRKRQQSELMFSLGQFFGPVLRVAEHPNDFDADEKARILARFFHDHDAFNQLLIKYCHSGESGHKYAIQFAQAQHQISLIHQYSTYNNISEPELLKLVVEVAQKVTDTIISIPVPVDSAIYEAQTPFSTYCFVKDICSTAHATIVWLDRYFDQTIFHRFLVDTPRSAQITLVTLPPASGMGKADAKRIADFMDISRLFAQERGTAGYRLVANSQFHDRWLQCDNKLFTLGGSIKDLDKPFTISRLDSNPDNQKHFDGAVVDGTELFGPSQPNHP
jgi:hypothetical protein